MSFELIRQARHEMGEHGGLSRAMAEALIHEIQRLRGGAEECHPLVDWATLRHLPSGGPEMANIEHPSGTLVVTVNALTSMADLLDDLYACDGWPDSFSPETKQALLIQFFGPSEGDSEYFPFSDLGSTEPPPGYEVEEDESNNWMAIDIRKGCVIRACCVSEQQAVAACWSDLNGMAPPALTERYLVKMLSDSE